jgi:uncharacterized protein
MTDSSNERTKGRQGLASMSAERRREIASKGGSSVPGEHRMFAKRRDLASKAGRKGGLASGRRRHAEADRPDEKAPPTVPAGRRSVDETGGSPVTEC